MSFLLAVLVAGSVQLQTLGPFADREACEDVAKQLRPMVKTYQCIKLPAVQAPK